MTGLIVPECDTSAVPLAISVVGAVIMPHNLYLHSALVTSRSVDKTSVSKVKEANFYNAIESSIALLVSFVINLFVLAVFADICTSPSSCDSLEHAAYTLQAYFTHDYAHPSAALGQAVLLVFAVGILAAGQSSTMTGTYAGQVSMSGFINLKIKPWKRVFITRSLAMIPTILFAVLAPPAALPALNNWMNIAQSLMLPFALVPVMHFSSIPGVMNVHKNGILARVFGWTASVAIIALNLYLVWVTFADMGLAVGAIVVVVLVCAVYLVFTVYLIVGPALSFGPLKDLYSIQHTPRVLIDENTEDKNLQLK
eukprot:UC1_evm1s2163